MWPSSRRSVLPREILHIKIDRTEEGVPLRFIAADGWLDQDHQITKDSCDALPFHGANSKSVENGFENAHPYLY